MKKTLLAAFIVLGALGGLFLEKNTALAAVGNIHHWKFDGNCNDELTSGCYSGSGSYVSGYDGLALENGWAAYGGSPSSISNTFTISFWVNFEANDPSTMTNTPLLYEKASDASVIISFNGSTHKFNLNVLGHAFDGDTTPAPSTWYRITATYNGSIARLYLNGVEDGSTSVSGSISDGSDLYIGTYHNNPYSSSRWDGLIDEGSQWDYALTPEEVAGDYYDFTGAPGFLNAASLEYPVSTSTPISDFSYFNWNGTTTIPTYHLKATITYTNPSHFYIDTHTYDLDEGYPSSSQWQYPALAKTHLLSNGNWAAYVQIFDTTSGSDVFIASSSWDYFVIGAPSYPGTSTPIGDITPSSTIQITCDPNSGLFAYSACNMLLYLFVPPAGTFDEIAKIYTRVENKPPFGYIPAIQTAFGGFNSSSSAAFSFPDVSALDAGIFDPLRIGVAWALWLLFGFWVFHKFRNIQL